VADPAGLAALRALGARSVPVVARGDRFVFAQVLRDVIEFLDIPDDAAPKLTPAELQARYDVVLQTGTRLVRQMPDALLENQLPNRPRSWRNLMHHIFQIPTAYLDMEEKGGELTRDLLSVPPPDDMRTSAAIAEFGDSVRGRFADWAQRVRGEDFSGQVPTYFGGTTRHEMLERTVWHSAQHVRQIASLLEQVGITPDRPLTRVEIQGLPLTDKIWDEG
jgi:hypothetical protein